MCPDLHLCCKVFTVCTTLMGCLNRGFARITGFHGFFVQRSNRILIRVICVIQLIRDSDKEALQHVRYSGMAPVKADLAGELTIE